MYCPYCGKNNLDDSSYCTSCGKNIKESKFSCADGTSGLDSFSNNKNNSTINVFVSNDNEFNHENNEFKKEKNEFKDSSNKFFSNTIINNFDDNQKNPSENFSNEQSFEELKSTFNNEFKNITFDDIKVPSVENDFLNETENSKKIIIDNNFNNKTSFNDSFNDSTFDKTENTNGLVFDKSIQTNTDNVENTAFVEANDIDELCKNQENFQNESQEKTEKPKSYFAQCQEKSYHSQNSYKTENIFDLLKKDISLNKNLNGFQKQDGSSFFFTIIGLLFPLIGMIMWGVLSKDCPKKAKSFGIGVIISIVFGFVIFIIYIIVTIIKFFGSMFNPFF
ncbi:MAG: zinc ribbon domain-containing protein [Clostridia bacterium]